MSTESTTIITGASGGLGLEVTRRLLARGDRVVAWELHPREDALRAALGPLAERLTIEPVDVTDLDQVEAAFARLAPAPLGGVAHLVGGYDGGAIDALTPEHWERLIHLNLRSSFVVVSAAARALAGQPGAPGIVCVGSLLARRGAANHAAYAATKAAVLALVRSAAADLQPRRVRVNAVLPSTIATPANLEAMPDADHAAWVTPAQVADAIAFLLSEGASGVTGACVEVAGRGYSP